MSRRANHERPIIRIDRKLFDRTPPHAPEAEQIILGAMMLSPLVCEQVRAAGITTSDFYIHRHQSLFDVITDQWQRGAVNPQLILQRLTDADVLDEAGGKAFLLSVARVAEGMAATVPHWIAIVRGKTKLRRLIEAAGTAVHEAFLIGEAEDVDELIAQAQAGIAEIDRGGTDDADGTPQSPYEPFPVSALPEPLAAFVTSSTAAIGCDEAMLALPLLVACGAAIGTSRAIQLKSGWMEFPIVWGGVVAQSGTLKSPAMRAAMAAMEALQAALMRDYEANKLRHARDTMEHEKHIREWKAHGTSDPPLPPPEPTAERIMVSDTTVEALGPILRDNPRGVILAVDELDAWFRSQDLYTSGNKGADPRWLSMFNAQPMLIDRRKAGTLYVPRAFVSVIGTIQPKTLRRSLTREYRDSGLAARMLLTYPPVRSKRWTEAQVPDSTMHAIRTLTRDLRALQPDTEDGRHEPIVVQLGLEAKQAWIHFYNDHAAEQEGLAGDLAQTWSKLEAYAARFAIILHSVRVANGEDVHPDYIDPDSMNGGIALARWFGHEARRIYTMLGESQSHHERRELTDLIRRRGGTITGRDLMRARACEYPTATAAETALGELVRQGIGRWEWTGGGNKPGRPAKRLILRTPSLPEQPDAILTDSQEAPIPAAHLNGHITLPV